MKMPSSPMRLGAFSLMASGLGLLAGLPAQAQSVIVNDTFTGLTAGAQGGGALGNVGWYFFNPSAAGYAWKTSSAPEGAVLLSGTTLATGSGARSNTYAFRPFSPVTLGNVGDSITLQLDFRAVGAVGHLVVGLMDFAEPLSSTVLGGGVVANPLIGVTGVEFSQHLSAYSNRTYRYGAYGFDGTAIAELEIVKAGDYAAVGDNVDHRLVLTLIKESNGLHVLASITETDGSTTTLAGYTISAAGDFTFNTLRLSALGVTGAGNEVYFDNIVISRIATPISRTGDGRTAAGRRQAQGH